MFVNHDDGTTTYTDPRLAFAVEEKDHVNDFRQRFDSFSTALAVKLIISALFSAIALLILVAGFIRTRPIRNAGDSDWSQFGHRIRNRSFSSKTRLHCYFCLQKFRLGRSSNSGNSKNRTFECSGQLCGFTLRSVFTSFRYFKN